MPSPFLFVSMTFGKERRIAILITKYIKRLQIEAAHLGTKQRFNSQIIHIYISIKNKTIRLKLNNSGQKVMFLEFLL